MTEPAIPITVSLISPEDYQILRSLLPQEGRALELDLQGNGQTLSIIGYASPTVNGICLATSSNLKNESENPNLYPWEDFKEARLDPPILETIVLKRENGIIKPESAIYCKNLLGMGFIETEVKLLSGESALGYARMPDCRTIGLRMGYPSAEKQADSNYMHLTHEERPFKLQDIAEVRILGFDGAKNSFF